MATNDFVQDVVEKLTEDNIEFIVIALQKGKGDHRANAFYNITTADGAEMILITIDEVFASDAIADMLPDTLFVQNVDEVDAPEPDTEFEADDDDDSGFEADDDGQSE